MKCSVVCTIDLDIIREHKKSNNGVLSIVYSYLPAILWYLQVQV